MKKILMLAAVVILSSMLSSPGMAWAQPPQSSARSVGHKVGLIDMAEIFGKYEKFQAQLDDLKAEIAASEQQARQTAGELKQLKAQLESGNIKKDSPDFLEMENRFTDLSAELNTFRRQKQRAFIKKEADIYKTIYLEVTDAVQKFCSYNDYTLVIRFNRKKLDAAAEPADVHRTINSQVVYYRKQDDITEVVLEYLNKQYQSAAGNTPSGQRSARQPQAGGPRR